MVTSLKAQRQEHVPYVLGLDLGTNSIGWAILKWDGERPTGLMRLGVRRFEAGVSGNIEAGRDEAPGAERRAARQQRRQFWRRAWRMRHVYRVLTEAGLLPAGGDSPDERHKTINSLDRQLAADLLPPASAATRSEWHVLPYRLRALALDRSLPSFALGRALYHLAARRGYLSNLKAKKDLENEGIVKSGISELQQALDGRTLGQYFSALDPEEKRIRERYSSRQMYLDEFERIWTAQLRFEPTRFPDDLKQRLHNAIFYQRPLKSQRGLVGRCGREPTQRRAPKACLIAQHFVVLQKLNDLEVESDESNPRRLTDEERHILLAELTNSGDLTWAKVRTLLKLRGPRGDFRGDRFNLEEGGEKKLVGNRTSAVMLRAIGKAWSTMPAADQSAIVDEILSFTNEEALIARLQKGWGVSGEQARNVVAASFEEGYVSLSRRAIKRLLPHLERGAWLQSAMKDEYGAAIALPTLDELPPVQASNDPRDTNRHPAFTQLRNPTVSRALTELRKVVNAILRRYGKPVQIRIELARDLKKSRKDRQDIQSRIKTNERSRDNAKKRIVEERGNRFNTPHNILKLRLAEECRWVCPYTGKSISMETLISEHPQFDVEHIYPFSWSLDNSFSNKTLCYVSYNRDVKRNLTPYVAASATPEWPEIINRVRRFIGPAAKEKLRRFLNEEVAPGFSNRQLSETRYISRLAADYLALLYGGRNEEGEQRVWVRTGQSTAYLRAEFQLNTLLGDPEQNEKSRADHRHHAIDALVVALTDQSTIQQLAQSAEIAERQGQRRLFTPIGLPWPTLLDDVRQQLDQINVSSRISRKLAGSLHDATVYSKPHTFINSKGKATSVHHVRKPLVGMSLQEVERIVDDRVRELVQKKLDLIGLEPAKAFQDNQNLPYLTARDGRIILIKRARIRKSDSTIQVGQGTAARYVAPGANNHMEIVAALDAAGTVKKWEGIIVSRFEANRRNLAGEEVVRRDHGPSKKFLFSLAGGEHVIMRSNGADSEQLLRVTVISEGQLELVEHRDARPITERKQIAGARIRCTPNSMWKLNARKVVVDPLGTILPAGD